eukprot:m.114244 g.114244  ORF g.114244 m.114244 type:complete len:411 (+) comp16286_c0_seq1:104-1336(+)
MASGRGSGAGLCLIRPPSAAVVERMVACRRTMHRHPDLSEQEQPTCERICSWLDELGIAHRTCVGGRGVVADIPGQRAGPVIALRADTDALPLQEATELDFSSCKDGVMHACGHDGHTAGLLGAAQLLVENAVAPPLPVRLLFQPAEEVSTGAKSMIEDNALDDVAYVFGGHIDRHYPTGSIVVQPGCVNAFADAFVIRIIGKGGHAARPHQCHDAVLSACSVVLALQTITSRILNPAENAVLTVGKFQAGTAGNIIAGEAVLHGTVRTVDPDTRNRVHQALREVSEKTAFAHGTSATLEFTDTLPGVINDPSALCLAKEAATAVVGQDRVRGLDCINFGGEDFSYYLHHVPGCYVRYGADKPCEAEVSAHSPGWDFNEETLPVIASYLATIAHTAGASWVARQQVEKEQ